MKFPRSSGILLHVTSLPGDFGIGDLGQSALKFIDRLAEAKQTYWQVLPLGPTGYGDSPYQSFSAFAGNTLLTSPQRLFDDGLLTEDELSERPDFQTTCVDFGKVFDWKNHILSRAYANFSGGIDGGIRDEFESFKSAGAYWLDDYSLYRALKHANDHKAWFEWDEKLKQRDPNALEDARGREAAVIETEKFYQFLFFRQWAGVRQYANERGIRIIGDLPIFVALDSADVWCNQDQFKLEADGRPKFAAGVPPDFFSSTGQLWGNPTYDWEKMQADGFRWWIARARQAFEMADVVRLDHFRGFAAAWEVPGGDRTAENGTWVNAPGRELFSAMENEIGSLPFIAEDLGDINEDVRKLRDDFDFPGMRILQFAFGGDAGNENLPHNYSRSAVAYTGNHDNDTTRGWYAAGRKGGDRPEILHCRKYLDTGGDEINWDFIRAVLASVADIAIIPMQDIMGLGGEARMNLPASLSGNWSWRFEDQQLSTEILDRIRELTEIYGRVN